MKKAFGETGVAKLTRSYCGLHISVCHRFRVSLLAE